MEDAEEAKTQHICLCRNEDVMLPTELIELNDESEFDDEERFPGYESFSCDENADNSIFCGLNKYNNKKQYIQFKVMGTPLNLR